jgi:uncharacterized protein
VNKKVNIIISLLFSLSVVILGSVVLPAIPIQNDIKELFEDKTTPQPQVDSFEKQPSVIILTINQEQPYSFQSKIILQQLKLLTDSIKKYPNIDTVLSIVNTKLPRLIGSTVLYKPLINLNKEKLDSSDWLFATQHLDITPLFLNTNWSKTNLFLQLRSNLHYSDSLGKQLEATAAYFGFESASVIGNDVFDYEIKTRVEKDIFRLAFYGFVLIIIAFWVFFQSFQVILFIGWMVVLNVNASILFIWVLGVEFNIMTAIIPTLIAILSVTDLNHIVHINYDNQHIANHNERINTSYHTIKYALIMTSVTTAIGFAIFLFSEVQTIIDFGIIAILSIGFSLFSAWYIAPQFVSLISFNKIRLLRVQRIQSLIINLITRHTVKLSFTFIVALLITGFFTVYLWNINYIIYDDLEKDSSLSVAYREFNDQFQGTRTIEITITDPADYILTSEHIHLLEKIDHYLTNQLGFNFTQSYNDLLKNYNRALQKGDPATYVLPEETALFQTGFKRISETVPSPILHQFLSKDGKSFKLVGFSEEIYASEGIAQLNKLDTILNQLTSNNGLTFTIGGAGQSRDFSTTHISNTIIYGIFISIGLISIIMGITYRSIVVGIVAWLVNLLPVFTSIALLFLLGFHITPAIAMMLSISFGIALDDTIYFLGRLKTFSTSISEVSLTENVKSITYPVVSTSIILSLSFCALFFSSFSFNLTNALIIISTLIVAMICDLIFLPTLLYLFKKR